MSSRNESTDRAPVGAASADSLSIDDLRLQAQHEARALRQRIGSVDADAIQLLFTGARSHYAWTDRPVSEAQLRALYDVVKMGPTSMNGCPARFVFITSEDGKARLSKALKPANVPKMMGAPVTAIIAYDPAFWEKLPALFPHEDRRGHFSGKPDYAEETAFRNSTLQGGYLMIAARAMGLDVGAMSGFTNEIVDQEFFSETGWKSNFLCNIGYADESALFQRLPRFDFDEACTFA
ncbi:MAG: malonic semialdehyde reductase [Pseudomonadota bacterium]